MFLCRNVKVHVAIPPSLRYRRGSARDMQISCQSLTVRPHVPRCSCGRDLPLARGRASEQRVAAVVSSYFAQETQGGKKPPCIVPHSPYPVSSLLSASLLSVHLPLDGTHEATPISVEWERMLGGGGE